MDGTMLDQPPAAVPTTARQDRELLRELGLVPATALNVNNMIGIGPFIVLPLLVTDMGGPQALLAWLVGAVVAVCDGMVWSELATRVPASGGSYGYLKSSWGARLGPLLSFLFLWQVCFQAPLSMAGGCLGFAEYLGYLLPWVVGWKVKAAAMVVALTVMVLLFRRIQVIGRMGTVLAVGGLAALLFTLAAGLRLADWHRLMDLPAGAFDLHRSGFWFGLGDASRLSIYAFLGYYNVCFLGEEVKEPRRTIPRSIFLAVLFVGALYVGMNAAVLAAVPWKEIAATRHFAPLVAERAFGPWAGRLVTLIILWTAFGSLFAVLLANSRVLYAAARDGQFFRLFARVHPVDRFPGVALGMLGCATLVCALLDLRVVITYLIVIRATVQFMGQNIGLALMRRREPGRAGVFRMPWYPLPSVVALAGWIFIFGSAHAALLVGSCFLGSGCLAFLAHRRYRRIVPA
jgi:amino acid transporter